MPRPSDNERPMYVISIAAELAGVHPQTLRVYERKGLLQPQRTSGNSRRYSDRDIAQLRRIQELTNEGVNLAGVMRILELEAEIGRLRRRADRAMQQVDELQDQLQQAMDARAGATLVRFSEVRRVRRAMKADLLDEAPGRRPFAVPPVGAADDPGAEA